MIKVFVAACVATLALATVAPEPADAASKSRVTKSKSSRNVATYHAARRPASVGANGLCQRDTGTPDSQLNFRNKCDVEEYWNRIMDRGNSSDK